MAERIPALKRTSAEGEAAPRRKGGKLLWIVFVLFVVVMIFLFFRSSLSKVSSVQISGNVHVTAEDVMSAGTVREGDSFFFPGAEEMERRIRELPPVESVKVTKRFPGKIEIAVKEFEEVAVELDETGKTLVVLASGIAVPVSGDLPDKPVLTGWSEMEAQRSALCVALGQLPDSLLRDLSQIAPDPSSAYPDRIKIFTRSRFEVTTTIERLPEKTTVLSEIVENREPGKVVLLEADTYRPFSAQTEPDSAG
ncbi:MULTISPECIES: cell division protein FtsQ/DivIB [Cohnella]|uniref:cell division protein FtsQ/DivIB n=1 Tax=Cohnella TaxID=329857 RepID=UPI0009BBCF9A|nr:MULTISPECIES: FtsQ-type POTRA domain-containing protein [Cohnella]MBN2983376.1 FtsQ-type POTRA domain-containing protein [Cohnella algarum]